MTRGLFVIVLALALAAGADAASSPHAVPLVEAGHATFPDRAYVLDLPKGVPASTSASVSENGSALSGVSFVSADAARQKQFAVVLAIDASESMRGRPTDGAWAAARAFAAHRSPNQQLAIIAFNSKVNVVLPFTTDAASITAALAHPAPLADGTKIYDAVEQAALLLKDAGVQTGSIVVLSDGTDVGSSVDKQTALGDLHKQGVRVYTVGLASKQFDREALVQLAAGTNATFSQANTTDDLSTIYSRLGYKLSNEYLLRYRSLANPGEKVSVRVRLGNGVIATAAYRAPLLAAKAPAPYHESLADRILQSWILAVVVALLVAGIAAWFLSMAFRPRKADVRARVAAFVSSAGAAQQRTGGIGDDFVDRAEKSLARLAGWERLVIALDVSGLGVGAGQLVVATALVTFALMFLFAVAFGVVGFLLACLVPLGVWFGVRARVARRRRQFSEQLPDNLEVMAAALRAGHSLMGALSNVSEAAPEPSCSEFRRIVADEQLGARLEDAIGTVVVRMDNRDLDQIALVARLQREAGTSSVEVIDRVVENIRARMELRRLVKTLTAQGRMSRWVLTAIPFVLAGLLTLLNRNYLNPLLDHGSGKALLVLAAVMIVAGSLVIKRIVNIKV